MSLIKNSFYNLAGFAIPTLIAVPALGYLARVIGVEAFGIFTLAFAIVGYASIFDAGLSRAVIREISIYRDDLQEQYKIIATSGIVVLFMGCTAAILLLLSVPHLNSFLKVSVDMRDEVRQSFILLAFIIPIYLLNQIWLAWLEGHEKFININIQRSISNSAIAGLPALCCIFQPTLKSAIIGLIFGRLISFIITCFICRKIIISSGINFSRKTFIRLIKFGGWLTISNIISPMMVYFDRFVVSNLLGAGKVAFYTVPSEGIGRLLNIPAALARALFPKLSYAQSAEERIKLEKQSILLMSIICVPVVIICLFFSKQLMSLWMGEEFGIHSAHILQVLIVGFYFNALAQIPYSLIQAAGKAKFTAFIHLSEIIPYLIILYVLTLHYGLLGTAIAWTGRVALDALLLKIVSNKLRIYKR
ncbi:TPA: flippase [Citrobacter freundii]|uniref:flippase n=1 Tax=Citrobacter freundii TaxID=546 RepID=UPI0020301424|nr:flippase [Citrobacter freundii]EKU3684549.1 flippase [Citrobacter freundii]URV33950.1 flippase [Citrobacter freundii]